MEFTGRIGSTNSQLGLLIPGYDLFNEVVVTWIVNKNSDDNTKEINFTPDEAGGLKVLLPNIPTILTKSQAAQARNDGAILLSLGSF